MVEDRLQGRGKKVNKLWYDHFHLWMMKKKCWGGDLRWDCQLGAFFLLGLWVILLQEPPSLSHLSNPAPSLNSTYSQPLPEMATTFPSLESFHFSFPTFWCQVYIQLISADYQETSWSKNQLRSGKKSGKNYISKGQVKNQYIFHNDHKNHNNHDDHNVHDHHDHSNFKTSDIFEKKQLLKKSQIFSQ